MKMIKFFSIVAVAALLGACASSPATAPASAGVANVGGSWALNVDTPMGARDMKLVATQTGETLAGTMQTELGELPITGKVTGNNVAFVMNVSAQGMDLQIDYAGTVEGDAMKGTMKLGEFGEGTWTGKRL
jgi:hypothetical protein